MKPPIAAGTILQNRYHVISVLGQGGFGRTYLAEDQGRFNELCALKELIPPEAEAYALEKSKELFQREATTLYQIKHPQVPQFRANFEEDGRLFLVQDYVEGKTYRELLRERKNQQAGTYIQGTNQNLAGQAPNRGNTPNSGVFSETEVRQLLKQLLPVLDHIHSKGIIHRDITPDNIILRTSDNMPVLIDFGVVKELATRFHAPSSTAPITTVGKVGYAPSEQIQTGRAYPSSDLYSLAASAVVLLTGKEPQSLFDDDRLTWNWRQWADVSDEFASVLNRMLGYRPGDRYQSAAEVLQALDSGTVAPPPVTTPPIAQTPDPNVSQAATMAVGRRPEPVGSGARSRNSADPVIREPNRNTLWDSPGAVIGIALGLAVLAGLGSWALFRSLRQAQQPPLETATETTTDTLTPTPSPTTVRQRLDDLVPGQFVTKDGNVQADSTAEYIFGGEEEQQLTASLADEGVLMTILGPDGQPLDRARRVQRWEGTLPFTGDYTIQLSPVQGLPESNYRLSLSLTSAPAPSPTVSPTTSPTVSPTPSPTASPTVSPTTSPTASPTVSPTPSPTASPTTSPSPTPQYQSEQINLPGGQGSIERSGQTGPERIKRYVVNVQQNQQLTASVPQGSGLALEIRSPDDEILESGVEFWQNPVPSTGQYKIDVISSTPTRFTIQIGVQNAQ